MQSFVQLLYILSRCNLEFHEVVLFVVNEYII